MTTPAATCTIVYDGTCTFCIRQMAWIRARDTRGVFRFVPNKAPNLLTEFPQLANDDLNNGLRMVDAEQAVHVGPDAVYQVARRLPATGWFAWLYRVPIAHSIARLLYGWIAARRYKLAGRCEPDDTNCRVPDA